MAPEDLAWQAIPHFVKLDVPDRIIQYICLDNFGTLQCFIELKRNCHSNCEGFENLFEHFYSRNQ